MMEALRTAASAAAGAARALPFAAYRDPALFELEMERVFRGDWVAVCSAAALSEPGSYYALQIGGEPVAVVRGKDGELRALGNSCRHRGTLLLDPGHGELGSNIVCPYHAWAYDLGGGFRGAPFTGDVEIAPAEHALARFALEVFAGVVFVNVDGQAKPLAERMAGALPHFSPYDVARYDTPMDMPAATRWEANWKLAFENGIESYHVFQVHRETLEKFGPTRTSYYIEGSAAWALTGGTTGGDLRPYPGEPETLGEHERTHYVLLSLPPSFIGFLTREAWGWIAIHPTSPESCDVVGEALVPAALAQYSGGAGDTAGGDTMTEAFFAEDKIICERGQRGIQARHSAGGQLVELERVVGDFHQYLGARLFDAPTDAPYRAPCAKG